MDKYRIYYYIQGRLDFFKITLKTYFDPFSVILCNVCCLFYQFFPDTFVHGNLTWAWSRFEKMIGAVSQITNLANIFEDFMYQAYSEFLQDNVQYIEFRTLLAPVCKVRRPITFKCYFAS